MKLAIIPARGGSKRIPRKNIVDFHGRPILAHVLEMAKRSGQFDRIHVSTEDAEIARVAAEEGAPPDFLRDPSLADDHTPLLPVLRWVTERYAEQGEQIESVCLLMATAVLVSADDLAAAYRFYDRHGGTRAVMAVADFPCPVEWALRLDRDGALTPVQPGFASIRSQDLPKAYYDSGTFILFPRSALDAMSIDAIAPLAFPIARWKAVDIDGAEDLEMAARLFRPGGAD